MSKTVIAVWFNQDGPPHLFSAEHREGKSPWQVTQHNGVNMLMIRQTEGSHVRHAIPLSNVLYWTVSDDDRRSDSTQSSAVNDRYCNGCKVNFNSSNFGDHPYPDHDVRRTCCGTSPQSDHHPSCTSLDQLVESGFAPGGVRDLTRLHPSDYLNIHDRPRGGSVTS